MVDYRKSITARIDWITIVIYLLMVGLGWVSIYAATHQEDQSFVLFDMSTRYSKQFVFLLAALVLALIVIIIDSEFWVLFTYPIYLGMVLILILVLFVGEEINGARSWFVFGPLSMQPAEFAKIATVLALSKFLSRFNFEIHKTKNLLLLALMIIAPTLLILKQNDTGTAMVFLALVLVLFREGLNESLFIFGLFSVMFFFLTLVISISVLIPLVSLASLIFASWRIRRISYFIFGSVLLAGIFMLIYYLSQRLGWELSANRIVLSGSLFSAPIVLYILYRTRRRQLQFIFAVWLGSVILIGSVDFLFNEVLEEHQRLRIDQVLGMDNDPLGAGYNLNQSKIAIGSGGFMGKGFLQGTQTRFDFVPEQSTDFIFCTIGEEWGFVGSTLIVLLFAGFLIRLIFLAERQRSHFSRIFGYGVFSIFFFHFLVNIGMTIGIVPVIGIPLPFFSYGGSSLWSFTILLFIFLHLDTDRFDVVA
ncbi:MAG: rod shape-determining protein RodA [Bacteroidetes bacterium]|jgi:rod shape determining protein RodA|nr:rod shape-determining protein RodA [Bacteroidota bacterium]MBT3748156.1 rod shape-determining protein RodA [Bacteroidota bacterium]MBT4411526.1 rod shape-determining protein RodA [Bacteroidota bacterium]MBT5425911.1 rod shape-determining protein RodA [Bacteroidota bacterium]MBT7094183.1 rod shape-determining protein RodA [Bacteroidota bacterium]